MKGEYVVLVCQKHYLPTCVFTVSEKLVAAYISVQLQHASSRVRACVFLAYAHDTPPRVQHFSAFHCIGASSFPFSMEHVIPILQ